jgi:hypothetical protein
MVPHSEVTKLGSNVETVLRDIGTSAAEDTYEEAGAARISTVNGSEVISAET